MSKSALHEFPPMTGPFEGVSIGSYEWAENISARLQMHVRHVSTNSVRSALETIRAVFRADPKPWTIWPQEPYRTPDEYFRRVTGHRLGALLDALDELCKNELGETKTFVNELRSEIAVFQKENRNKGGRGKLQADGLQLRKQGSNSREKLLRRLADKAPLFFARYRRGEFESAAAAVRAAQAAGALPKTKKKKQAVSYGDVCGLVEALTVFERQRLRRHLDLLIKKDKLHEPRQS